MAVGIIYVKMFQDQFSPQALDAMREKLTRIPFLINRKGCHIWTRSTCRKGYPRIRITATTLAGRKFSKVVTVARLVCFLRGNGVVLDPRQQASHMCNERTCCNIAHLSLEPNATNHQRRRCHLRNRCSNHGNKPNCIF